MLGRTDAGTNVSDLSKRCSDIARPRLHPVYSRSARILARRRALVENQPLFVFPPFDFTSASIDSFIAL